jgi:PP-loop superfamily ATP-utilizing enzyme
VMRQLGFTLVRVRLISPATASLEVAAEEVTRACDLLPQISRDLEAIGFTRVNVDLEGYRQGKLNFGHASAATKFATAKTGESR